jgi:hypothetical protein
VILHGLNTGLVFWLLSYWVPGIPALPFLGALFFGAHPAQVEAAAWVSGTKDTLSGFFALLALVQLYRERPKHWAATLFFMLSILSKPSAIVLPLLVAILNRYWKGLPWRENWRPALWAVLSVPFLYLTRFSQPEQLMKYVPPIWERPIIVADTIVFYLSKVLFPLFMVADYARNPQLVLTHRWGYLGSAFLLALCLWLWRRGPQIKVLLALFVLSLLPVLGIVPFFFQFFSTVADRYLYLPLVFGALAFTVFLKNYPKPIIVSFAALVLLGFTLLSKRQVMVWRNDEALFTHLVAVNPHSLLGHNNLGTIYENQERYDLAAFHYARALAIYPESLPPLYKMGRIRGRERKYVE